MYLATFCFKKEIYLSHIAIAYNIKYEPLGIGLIMTVNAQYND